MRNELINDRKNLYDLVFLQTKMKWEVLHNQTLSQDQYSGVVINQDGSLSGLYFRGGMDLQIKADEGWLGLEDLGKARYQQEKADEEEEKQREKRIQQMINKSFMD